MQWNLAPTTVPPNQALQRAGTHKVLDRGRPSQERTRALARPRAETPRPVAELGS
jgi:hypothetical protein